MKKSITSMSTPELQREHVRIAAQVDRLEKEASDDPAAKLELLSVRALRFALECAMRIHGTAPAPTVSNVIDLAAYRAKRASKA